MPVFLAWLNIKAAEHAKAHPDQLSLDDTQVQGIKTFTQFDSLVTLPVFGFSTTEVRWTLEPYTLSQRQGSVIANKKIPES